MVSFLKPLGCIVLGLMFLGGTQAKPQSLLIKESARVKRDFETPTTFVPTTTEGIWCTGGCDGVPYTIEPVVTTTTDSPATTPYRCPLLNGRFPNPASCSSFITCSHGVPIYQDCPISLFFNPAVGYCDYPYNVPSCNKS